MTLAVFSRKRRIGEIAISGPALAATSAGLQDVADTALARHGGDAQAAYESLRGFTNGYITIVPAADSITAQALRETETAGEPSLAAQVIDLFNPDEPRDAKGRWMRSLGGIASQALGREAEYQAVKASRERTRQYPHIGPEHARGNSRPVSAEEFQRLARLGNQWIDRAKRDASPVTGLERNWDQVKADAYAEARKPWGGATIDAHTGLPIKHDADLYALSVKPRGMTTVSVPETASQDEFNAAMDRALAQFRPALERKAFHLGVFHDDYNHRIDIDPVAIVDSVDLVEQVGSYTRAVGGAFRFSDGNGYWPPHVAEGAGMANDDQTVHWQGPGEWHSYADAVQDPEPVDQPDDDTQV